MCMRVLYAPMHCFYDIRTMNIRKALGPHPFDAIIVGYKHGHKINVACRHLVLQQVELNLSTASSCLHSQERKHRK